MMVQPVIRFALVADWTSDRQSLPVDLKSGKLRVKIRKLTTLYSGNRWSSEKPIAMISKSASNIHCKPISILLVSNDQSRSGLPTLRFLIKANKELANAGNQVTSTESYLLCLREVFIHLSITLEFSNVSNGHLFLRPHFGRI